MPSLVSHEREKLINAIIYFAKNTRYLGKIKLFKLLYLLDFEHFRMTGRSVTGLNYYAWKRGPMPVTLYEEWKNPQPDLAASISIKRIKIVDYFRHTVRALVGFNDSHFTKRELRIMQKLADQHRDAKSPDMIDAVHAENEAWSKVWNEGKGRNNLIDYTLAVAEDAADRDAVLEAAKEYEAIASSPRH